MNHPEEAWLEQEFFRMENLTAFIEQFDRLRVDTFPLPYIDYEWGWTAMRQLDIERAGRADIVFVRTTPGVDTAMVIVVELKRHADESAVAQVLRYSGTLQNLYSRHDLHVVSVIGAFSFSHGALAAATAGKVHIVRLGLNKLQFIPSDAGIYVGMNDGENEIDCPRITEVLDNKLGARAESLDEEQPVIVAPPVFGA